MLQLQPGERKVIKAAGEVDISTQYLHNIYTISTQDVSGFVSCLHPGPSSSLGWAHRDPDTGQMVAISTLPGDRCTHHNISCSWPYLYPHTARVHTEARPGQLDLVFRSIRQGDEGEYVCRWVDISIL